MSNQLWIVYELMSDGKKRSLQEIRSWTGYPTQSIGSRLRDLRTPKYGGFQVIKEKLGSGTYVYRVVLNREAASVLHSIARPTSVGGISVSGSGRGEAIGGSIL